MGQFGANIVLPAGLSDIEGCRCSRQSITQVDIDVGVCRSGDRKLTMRVTALLTAAITSSGANGLDTGVEAGDTWYAIYVIMDSSGTNPIASLLSASFSNPTLPAGYDSFRRVGAVRNNSNADFIDFLQDPGGNGRWTRLRGQDVERSVLANGAAQVNTAVACAAIIPPSGAVGYFQCSNDGTIDANVSDADAATDPRFVFGSGVQSVFALPVDSSQQIFYDHAAAGGDLNIICVAYLDDLS